MTLEQLKTYLETYLPELYRFAFALLPDDLQAQQLVFDSISVLSLDRKALVLKTLEADLGNKAPELLELKKNLLGIIRSLALKRAGQLGNSCEYGEAASHFYELDMGCRGVVFLKHELSLDFTEIEFIMQMQPHEVISKLYMGRGRLSQDQQNSGIYE